MGSILAHDAHVSTFHSEASKTPSDGAPTQKNGVAGGLHLAFKNGAVGARAQLPALAPVLRGLAEVLECSTEIVKIYSLKGLG